MKQQSLVVLEIAADCAGEAAIASLGREYGLAAHFYSCQQEGRRGCYPHLAISVNSDEPFMREGAFDADMWERHQLHFFARSGPHGKGDLRRLARDIARRFDLEVVS